MKIIKVAAASTSHVFYRRNIEETTFFSKDQTCQRKLSKLKPGGQCCHVVRFMTKKINLRSPLLLTAAAALPPEFLQQSEHQIEAMGHVEPGQPKMNPTYPTNLFNLFV